MPHRTNKIAQRETVVAWPEKEQWRSEAFLAEAQRFSRSGSWGWNVLTGEIVWSRETFHIFGLDPERTQLTRNEFLDGVHPEDRPMFPSAETVEEMFRDQSSTEFSYRVLLPEGSMKYIHSMAHAIRNDAGDVVELVGTIVDVTTRKEAENALLRNEALLAQGQRISHTGSWYWNVRTGEVFWTEEHFHIFGFDPATDKPSYSLFMERIHPEDRIDVEQTQHATVRDRKNLQLDYRIVLPDGSIKYLQTVGRVFASQSGDLEYVGTVMDVTKRTQAENELRRSEAFLAEAQKLSHTGSWEWNVSTGEYFWSEETFRIFGLDPTKTKLSRETFYRSVHPEDRPRFPELERIIHEQGPVEYDYRIVLPEGSIKRIHAIGRVIRNGAGEVTELIGTVLDVTQHKDSLDALRRSEALLAQGERISHAGSWHWNVRTGELFWTEEHFHIFGYNPETDKPSLTLFLERVHPEERTAIDQMVWASVREQRDFELRYRIVLPDGRMKHLHDLGRYFVNATGELEFFGTVMDVTESKRVERALQRSEAYLAQAQTLSRTGSWACAAGNENVHWSRELYRIFGFDPQEPVPSFQETRNRIHVQDQAGFNAAFENVWREKRDFETDFRVVLPDGSMKNVHAVGHCVINRSGETVECVGTAMDVTPQHESRVALENAYGEIKILKDRLYKENLALREEIDHASMSEEIVGSSQGLRRVLGLVAKVAPTDATVLITGETGTGKELVAHALHKKSRRAGHVFLRVNCAAIPAALIASELFGHEKGAFTGAWQQRMGRFEMADGGTIFLDEVGELPQETQIALLRVLQEREFERVGGGIPVRVDVRVLAAANRNLEAAVATGVFRQDLFYRLNVFPIEMPPLRERAEDIRLLVEYFIERYARSSGKKIRNIERKTMDLLQSYRWPGNVRELQNVIERALILSENEILSVDETWLRRVPPMPVESSNPLLKTLADGQREMIEAALAESAGRVSGSSGAAVKLGIPRSTLEAKIRILKINKHRFKPT